MTPKQLKKQNILIKGTKDGLTFFLNDQCSFDSLITELQLKLSERPQSIESEDAFVRVKLVTGMRYLSTQQIELLSKTLSDYIQGVIETIDSDVITKAEAEDLRKNQDVNRLNKIIRSGQVVEMKGDLLLIGDVNPGGTVKATGNIFVMGKLLGIAHAGYEGNRDAVICASAMLPSQLRIADTFRRNPDSTTTEIPKMMECAFIDESGEIVVDRVQRLNGERPDLSTSF
ncbi:septum site-determining protein MinC [Evansella sp. AB-P1]|uniref:septum site-determining protein MinC n=1 Tax=Evansella sp. AB-P1 TaxID=3037653 RepID=UPI00241E1144|nr:septum site-determining protein MinC [Evansella sp. AB-P1]MDG5786849.1 septum site-determining protein MinC [Evansella sp. AB-P1]